MVYKIVYRLCVAFQCRQHCISMRLGWVRWLRAQWALHDFVRLAGEEGCTLYFEHFLKSGFSALPTRHQQRYPGLRCWGGIDEMKAALADFAGLYVGSRPLIAGRSANLMKLVAKLLGRGGKRVLITDLTWPSYQKILRTSRHEERQGKSKRVQVRAAIIRGAVSGSELVELIARTFVAGKCDGAFIPEISHDGIRLPIAEIVAASGDVPRRRSLPWTVSRRLGTCRSTCANTVRFVSGRLPQVARQPSAPGNRILAESDDSGRNRSACG